MRESLSFLAGLRRLGQRILRLPDVLPWAAVVSWMGVIWYASASRFPPGPPHLFWRVLGNLAHAPEFGILALFLCAALLRPGPQGAWPLVGRSEVVRVLLPVLIYAIVDEWHQGRTPGRQPSVFDVTTDVTGAVCVLWIVAYLGSPHASELGLWARLAGGLLSCVASALLASLV